MSGATPTLGRSKSAGDDDLLVVDCDFWPQAATTEVIGSYIGRGWREYLRLDNDGRGGRASWAYPETLFQSNLVGTDRQTAGDATLWGGGSAQVTADPLAACQTYLEAEGVGVAIVNPGTAASLSGLPKWTMAAELARATNDWTIQEWLSVDTRLRGSVVVAPRDPELASQEVRRVGGEKGMVQVLLAHPPCLLGNRFMHPLYEAAVELGLPVNLQAGGTYIGRNRGLTSAGHPASALEHDVGSMSGAQPHLLSMIMQGVFEKYPDLRLVLSGFGVAWLPSLLWRMDSEYARAKSGESVPALKRPPSEYVLEHVRFTIAPLELPADPRDLAQLLCLADLGRLLLFASGPNRDKDILQTSALLETMSAEERRRILRDTATGMHTLN